MNKCRNRPSNGKQAMSANLRKIARQNQLYGFRMALDGIAATWGALIQNLRCDADLTDENDQQSAWSVRMRKREVRMVATVRQLLLRLVDCGDAGRHRKKDEEVRV